MRILLYEDSCASHLNPVALLRPVFELVCGRESLRRRIQRWFPNAEFGGWIRPWLAECYREDQPGFRVNDVEWLRQGPVLLINGRWMPDGRLTHQDLESGPNPAGFIGGNPVWLLCDGDELATILQTECADTVLQFASGHHMVAASGSLMQFPWDLVTRNTVQLCRDFVDEGVSQWLAAEHVQLLGNQSDVYVSEMASIDPYVVIDARSGPVSIDRDTQIQSFTRIEGPCHIGRGSKIFRGLIRGGTTIGEHCRVGGEIEDSILHGYVNKYHEGFLGHSYLCPWVNMGAMSSTSDLKNDYSTVRMPLDGHLIDSGLSKLGSFIGDHSKTSMDCMFNTGSTVGVMTMLLAGGRLLPRVIPSFSCVMWGEYAGDWSLESCLSTVRVAMQRRGMCLTDAQERLLRHVYELTAAERTAAGTRSGRRAGNVTEVRVGSTRASHAETRVL